MASDEPVHIIDTTEDNDADSPEGSEIDEEEPSTSTNAAQSSSAKKKKKKKKSKKSNIPQALVDRVMDKVKADAAPGSQDVTEDEVKEALEQMKVMDVVKGKAGLGGINKKDVGTHKFWSTQPVPQIGEGPPLEDGYIEPAVPVEELRQEPYTLPKDFEWATVDIQDPEQIKEVYDLLSANYVEDDDASFRFRYTAEFLQWALGSPGYYPDWHIGVRVASNKKLVAFISGVPITLKVRKHTFLSSEINFLCVHKRLRSKRLAPVLIKEVTRRVNLKGIFQAIYTAGVVVPTPLSTCRYEHRLLNVSKLVSIEFCQVPRNMTLARMIRQNKLPASPKLPLREMEERDIVQVANLFAKYMARFDMVPIMNIDEVRYQFLSGCGTGPIVDGRRAGQVVWSYVVEDPESHKVTDYVTFYCLPSTVIGNTKHGTLDAAYLFYYGTATALQEGVTELEISNRLKDLVGDAVIMASNANFDVFNALTLMDNVPILRDLKFGQGNGYLHFYLYNWRTNPLAGMESAGRVPAGRGVGVVML